VTALLSRCLKRIGALETINAALVGNLLVGDRDFLIIKLREITFGQRIEAVLYCPNAACAKPLDVTFSLGDVPVANKTMTQRFFTMPLPLPPASEVGEENEPVIVEFRLPTGADQEALVADFNADATRAVRQLLARCVSRIGRATHIDETVIAALPASAHEAIEKKMQQLAPQVELEMTAVCPECQTPFVTPFDFAAFFWGEAKGNLSQLEREVHFLAWHYHWPEPAILSMMRPKRRRYVELLQEEIARFNQH
jgi:hypothetical protein